MANGVKLGRKPTLTPHQRREAIKRVNTGKETVEPRYHEHVAGVELVERAAELCAIGLRAARRLAPHFLRAGSLELAHLSVHALAVRRYPGITANHSRAGFDVARSDHAARGLVLRLECSEVRVRRSRHIQPVWPMYPGRAQIASLACHRRDRAADVCFSSCHSALIFCT